MIDCHSHIIPTIDDGASSIEEAITMLGLAYVDGVRTQVLTPHVHPERYDNSCASLRIYFAAFKDIAERAGIKLKLRIAGEFRISPQLMEVVQQDDMLWLGEWDGKKAFLLELPHSNVPMGSINIIKWLVQQNIVPIIVHPERNREMQKKPDLLKEFIYQGCLVQLTAGSLLGQFGHAATQYAGRLLKEGVVSFLATDCHNVNYRPPNLSEGVNKAAEIIGRHAAIELVTRFPQKLISNKQSGLKLIA